MASAGRGRSSVGRHLTVLLTANLVVLLGVGIVGIVATLRAHDSVQYLTKQLEPAADANAAAFQHLTDAETYLWAWGISGSQPSLDLYRTSLEQFRADQRRLEELSRLDTQVALLVDDLALSVDAWIDAYVVRRLAQPTGPDEFDDYRFVRGQVLFADVRSSSAAVDARLQELSQDADSASETAKRDLVVVLAAVVLAAAAVSLLIGRLARRRVTGPLDALEETAHRLAGGQHDARAPLDGPREVVQVAEAINRMADENDRARAVESHVVERLRALDSVRSDFVSNVSHELRTPLTSIQGYLELLEEEVARSDSDGPEHAMVLAAQRNVLRLGELIDDLLDLSRSEVQAADLVPLDLAALTRDVVTDLRVASSHRGVAIRLVLPDAPVPVRADAGQLTRVVTNLVSNAVKFTEGRAEVVVSVATEVGDDHADAVLAVEDHGIGIPAKELDQLGSRFYRASNAVERGITGTGLGLRIVQAIVENHHGVVDLRSTEGVGTTVQVRIPVDPGPDLREHHEPSSRSTGDATSRPISGRDGSGGTIDGRLRFTSAPAGDPAAGRLERKP